MKTRNLFEKTYQVTADHFVAGIIVRGDRIIRTAPILRWLKGKPFGELQLIAAGQRWKIEEIPHEPENCRTI